MGLATVAALSASPTLAATHKIILAPEIDKVWVATKGRAIECRSYRTPKAMIDCKWFHAISQSGLVDMVGNLVYIVRIANSQFRSDEYYVDPVHDVLPKGRPIMLTVPK